MKVRDKPVEIYRARIYRPNWIPWSVWTYLQSSKNKKYVKAIKAPKGKRKAFGSWIMNVKSRWKPTTSANGKEKNPISYDMQKRKKLKI